MHLCQCHLLRIKYTIQKNQGRGNGENLQTSFANDIQNMTICGLFLHQGITESLERLEQKLSFNSAPLTLNDRFSFNYLFIAS